MIEHKFNQLWMRRAYKLLAAAEKAMYVDSTFEQTLKRDAKELLDEYNEAYGCEEYPERPECCFE